MLNLTDIDLAGKTVMIREDLNVPIQAGKITSDARIKAALPTIKQVLKAGAGVLLLSHLGRPTEGQFDDAFSLAPVARELTKQLGQPVELARDWLSGVEVKPGQVVLCENVRFCPGEAKNDPELAKKMAGLCDVFVMDAFATAHRAQASTAGVIAFAKQAVAGPLLAKELAALETALTQPERPLVAIVGGSKVSTKLAVLEKFVDNVDQLILGGGIANTFIAATSHPVGKSLYEPDLIPFAQRLLSRIEQRGATLPLPVDVVVAKEFSANAHAEVKPLDDVTADDLILDIGPQTAKQYRRILLEARTVIWNGPVGVFEMAPFAEGTKAVANAIAESDAFSLAGGGDTIAAIEQFNITNDISYISTGGGAFLEFLAGDELPAIAALQARESEVVA